MTSDSAACFPALCPQTRVRETFHIFKDNELSRDEMAGVIYLLFSHLAMDRFIRFAPSFSRSKGVIPGKYSPVSLQFFLKREKTTLAGPIQNYAWRYFLSAMNEKGLR